MHRAQRSIVFFAAALAASSPAAAADDGQRPAGTWDGVLETLGVKAPPADPAPDFVRKTRPNPSRLEYMQRALPHKVSPLAVKTPDEVQAAKDALDAARDRQLDPEPTPRQLVRPKKAPGPKLGASAD